MMTRLRVWLRAIVARPAPPMSDYYAWRDSRPDRLADMAHRPPAPRSAAASDSPPVSSPQPEPLINGIYRLRRSSVAHDHTSDPHVACFEPNHAPKDVKAADWLRWPDSPDGTL